MGDDSAVFPPQHVHTHFPSERVLFECVCPCVFEHRHGHTFSNTSVHVDSRGKRGRGYSRKVLRVCVGVCMRGHVTYPRATLNFCVISMLCIILISFCGLRAFQEFVSVCVCPLCHPPQREVVMNHVSANLLFKGALRTEW